MRNWKNLYFFIFFRSHSKIGKKRGHEFGAVESWIACSRKKTDSNVRQYKNCCIVRWQSTGCIHQLVRVRVIHKDYRHGALGRCTNFLLTLYRLSGQIVFDDFSVGLANATPSDARHLRSQLPEVLGDCFFVDSVYRIWRRLNGSKFFHSKVADSKANPIQRVILVIFRFSDRDISSPTGG